MYRSHNNGALRIGDVGKKLRFWMGAKNEKGFMIWIDLRDRYGITQLIIDERDLRLMFLKQPKTLDENSWLRLKEK